jgi:hypothetical protein
MLINISQELIVITKLIKCPNLLSITNLLKNQDKSHLEPKNQSANKKINSNQNNTYQLKTIKLVVTVSAIPKPSHSLPLPN